MNRGFEFNISRDYAWQLFISQDRKCKLSGVDLYFYENRRNEQTASLDRIDSKIGYIEDNVQWVHKELQRMKMNMQDSRLIYWARKITEKNNDTYFLL